MSSIPDELPISDVRDNFADVIGRATYAGQITYVTKRGTRIGAIVPVELAEAAAEDAYLSNLAREADAELAAGATVRPLSEVVSDLDLVDDKAGEPGPPPPRRSPEDSQRARRQS